MQPLQTVGRFAVILVVSLLVGMILPALIAHWNGVFFLQDLKQKIPSEAILQVEEYRAWQEETRQELDVLSSNNLELLAAASLINMEAAVTYTLEKGFADIVQTTRAFHSLVDKNIFESRQETGGPIQFKHTNYARDWLTADGLLETVMIEESDNSQIGIYHYRKKGIIQVSQRNESLCYKSVSDIPIENIF